MSKGHLSLDFAIAVYSFSNFYCSKMLFLEFYQKPNIWIWIYIDEILCVLGKIKKNSENYLIFTLQRGLNFGFENVIANFIMNV